LDDINFVSNKDFDRDFASSLAFSDPLFNSFKSWSFGDVKEIDDGGATVHILVYIFVMSLFPWHVEVNNLVLIGVIYVKRSFDV
jgi:hypothetical protein